MAQATDDIAEKLQSECLDVRSAWGGERSDYHLFQWKPVTVVIKMGMGLGNSDRGVAAKEEKTGL